MNRRTFFSQPSTRNCYMSTQVSSNVTEVKYLSSKTYLPNATSSSGIPSEMGTHRSAHSDTPLGKTRRHKAKLLYSRPGRARPGAQSVQSSSPGTQTSTLHPSET
ncbi:hypothetical protein ElyMa_001756800 [Elysia marginata]|uniref:Uncharacterized protein n=1 Tax=Elysia marginata TaxID=1093978 RepID=A0AAV4EB83_9GAST|nr:hypothetical protein ElyMa_001756800 [Elysia marginata]